MAFKVGELYWKITGDTKDFDKKLKGTEKDAKGLTGTFTKLGSFISGAFAVAAVAGIAKVSTELIKAASAAEETQNKFNVTFSDIRDEADAAATALADGFGLSSTKAQQLLSDTGDLLTGFGFTQESALDLSNQVNQLAVDLASFTNFSGGAEGASAALTKALLGERESIKALGIAITEADIKQYAADLGLASDELSRQEKAQITLQLAIQQSKNAIGDFQRSQESFANQSRIAQAAVQDLSVEVGKNLLPIATQSISIFAELTRGIADFIAERNKLAEARRADKDDNATLEQRLLLIQQELASERRVTEQTLESGLISKQAAEQVKARSEARIAALNAELRGIALQLEAEALLTEEQRKQAEQEVKDQEARDLREEERLADIKRRDEAFSKTEEGRIAALEAEIAYFEEFKKSDEKAQIVLEALREELRGLTEEVEEQIEVTGYWSDEAQKAYNRYKSDLQTAKEEQEELNEETQDFGDITKSVFESALSGFEDLSRAVLEGGDAFQLFGALALDALSEVLRALGAQLAAEAAVAAVAGNIPAAVAAGAASAAAFAAAGATGLAASGIRESAQPAAAADTTAATETATEAPATTRTAATGGDIIFNNLILLGTEAEMRKAARKLAPYIQEELNR